VRLLALAVSGLVVLDPFLVQRVGFQLSVAACIGIVVLSPPLTRALPLPRAVAEPLAVTLAAQAGVAPLLVAVFGGVPVAGVPANVLATPLAGPVMVWGLSAGLVAGAVGGRVAAIAQWPTHVMISWIAWVAHRAALLPLGEIGSRELVVLGAGAATTFAASRLRFSALQRSGVAIMAVAVVAPAVSLRAPPPLHVDLVGGATLWRADAAVLEVDGRVDAAALLEGLRRSGVSSLDVVVGRTSSAGVRDVIALLRRRYAGVRVLLPSDTLVDTAITVGRLRIDARQVGGQLGVDISLVGGDEARAPPSRRGPRDHAPTVDALVVV
jgi:competence protein ComEC